MESKNGEAIIDGRIRSGVTVGTLGNTCIANDEDFKALEIEVKRVDPRRLETYLAKYLI